MSCSVVTSALPSLTKSSVDNGEVSGLLAHIFTVYQGSSELEASIVCLHCCVSECMDSF